MKTGVLLAIEAAADTGPRRLFCVRIQGSGSRLAGTFQHLIHIGSASVGGGWGVKLAVWRGAGLRESVSRISARRYPTRPIMADVALRKKALPSDKGGRMGAQPQFS